MSNVARLSHLSSFPLGGKKKLKKKCAKYKVKFALEQALKAQRGSRGKALLFL
jgi:hypothetical protein